MSWLHKHKGILTNSLHAGPYEIWIYRCKCGKWKSDPDNKEEKWKTQEQLLADIHTLNALNEKNNQKAPTQI